MYERMFYCPVSPVTYIPQPFHTILRCSTHFLRPDEVEGFLFRSVSFHYQEWQDIYRTWKPIVTSVRPSNDLTRTRDPKRNVIDPRLKLSTSTTPQHVERRLEDLGRRRNDGRYIFRYTGTSTNTTPPWPLSIVFIANIYSYKSFMTTLARVSYHHEPTIATGASRFS